MVSSMSCRLSVAPSGPYFVVSMNGGGVCNLTVLRLFVLVHLHNRTGTSLIY